MRIKTFKLRSLALRKGKTTPLDLDLEFEGSRAFVIWDSFSLGHLRLKARVEIDPALLHKETGSAWDYLYQGELILPHPENN
jgi:hypothetical protein